MNGGLRVVAALLLLCSLAAPALGQGGGTVTNVGPSVRSFLSQQAMVGSSTRLFGVVADGNGESDLAVLQLHAVSPSGHDSWSNHSLEPSDRSSATEPKAAQAGWRAWDPLSGDGRLSWSYEWRPEEPGGFSWTFTVRDESREDSSVLAVNVTLPPIVVHKHDLSWSLSVNADGAGGVTLDWATAPDAMGYQVWRSTSPYVLRAEIRNGTTTYNETLPAGHAVYKVTYFTSRDAAGGWAADGASAAGIPGWERALAAPVAGVIVAPQPSAVGAVGFAFAGGFILATVALILLASRQRRGP